jgi:ArsR family transcriptional regulator
MESKACSAEDASKYARELKRLADGVISAKNAGEKTRMFKALADEKRLRILGLLGAREMCVCEIMVALSLTQPTASHHLGVLENAGLVKSRKKGKWVFYDLTDRRLIERLHVL